MWMIPAKSHDPASEENLPKNLALVDAVDAIAKRKGITVGQLALAWLHAQIWWL